MLSEDGILPVELHKTIEAVKQDRTLRIAAQKCFPNVSHQILISRLKHSGFKVGLVTNSIRKSTEFMLEYAGLLHFMDVVITNEDVAQGKPNPDGYILAMSKLGVSPSETLVVEDGEYGIMAAESAGIEVIKVKDPSAVSIDLFLTKLPDLR
jgi:HAD superfamily hydrolase (TIGR01509 family)